ncbi:MAG: nuclear transport factor 2 family protein [Candidatus Cybelea sp.]|jgi:ketosteroid isomerase-like protein
MKRRSLFLAVAIAVAAGAFGLRAGAQSNDSSAIDALYQQFGNAFRHKDLNAIMLPYVHNNTLFVFDVSTPREHVGWDDYRADWKAFFDSIKGNPTFSISELSVTISGEVAYAHSIQSFSGNMGNLHAMAVRVTDVLRKTNGKWLIVEEHVSVPVDFTTLKPDFMSRP